MKCDSPYYVSTGTREKVPVPCGKCPNCKKRIVSEWSFRLEQEDKRSELSLFVTLTYDTRTIPITANGFLTLDKQDVVKFMKRLRKNTGKKLKYFAVGEYGSQRQRPHYHVLFFCSDDSITADEILDSWQLGAVHVGQVSSASVRYTCKYIDKPGRIPMFVRDDRQREFRLMSKHLGEGYLTSAIVDYHRLDDSRLYHVLPGQGIKTPMSKYYRNKIWDQNERNLQSLHIAEKVEEQEWMEEQQWRSKHPRGNYLEYLEKRRKARYQKFYNSQKVRK